MDFRVTKTVLLIVLIIGVVLQTGKLWFEEASGHNFFSSFMNVRVIAQESYSIEPEAAMVNLGGMKYIKLDINDKTGIKAISDNQITQLLKTGRFIETAPLNLKTLLDQKSVIYEYPLTISSEAFVRSFGEGGSELKNKVAGFDTIIICPARTSSENIRFYVLDTDSNSSHMFEGAKGVSEGLSKGIDSLREMNQQTETGLNYISSSQNSLDFFTRNVFLPEWQTPKYSYMKAYVANPIEETQNFERCAQLFFDNPVGILSAVDPAGVPFVSDRDVVVKYYEDNEVLEYTNYSTQNNGRVTFDMAYAAARNFFNRDATLENDIFLSGAVFENGVWSLFFEYSLNGVRMFCDSYDHAIEITVSGGSVAKYRRIVKRLAVSELDGQLDEGFIAVLDRVLAETVSDKMDDMELGYDISENGFRELAWYTEVGGKWVKR